MDFKIGSTDPARIIKELEGGGGLLCQADLVQHPGGEFLADSSAVVEQDFGTHQARYVFEELV